MAMMSVTDIVLCHKQLITCLAHCTLKGGWAPMFGASKHGHKDTVQLLLDHGAGVNIASKVRAHALELYFGIFTIR